ncbi:transcript variant X1 [Nothobranchius furzeri]|uniref:Transcript variant X1 n=2 Tax=Nothobranchius furzeri TaxID=105023 RepID=A0A8C6P7Q9_NOTFU|nr:transcript variant X1 [Nothobranchius furzeri]
MASVLTKDPTKRDSEGRAKCTVESEPGIRSTDAADPQNSLDSRVPSGPSDPPVITGSPTCVQTSPTSCEEVPISSPDSLYRFLFVDKCQRESHRVAAVIPGVTSMFLISSELNSQKACLLHLQNVVPECGPDGGDVHRSSNNAFPSYSCGKITSWGHPPLYAAPPPPSPPFFIPAREQPGSDMFKLDQLDSKLVKEEAVKVRLHDRAYQHYTQSQEGLKKLCPLSDISLGNLNFPHPSFAPLQGRTDAHFSWQKSPAALRRSKEVTAFYDSSQVLLQEALDSEATGSSSSSDDEPEHGEISSVLCSRNFERKWLEERAELGSRCSWLQIRSSELDGRIQQMTELHKNICATKGRVVLADSQPLTDRHIQQIPKGEMTDSEPSSPTRLLHNIKSQSDQLNLFVSSLKHPLSFSTFYNQDQTLQERGTIISGPRGGDVYQFGSSERKKPRPRRLFKADRSFMCARTRPLVAYHKHKLFHFKSITPTSPQETRNSAASLSSPLSPPSCLFCSCHPVNLSDCGCRSNFRTHRSEPVSGFLKCHRVQRVTHREEWLLRPLVINHLLLTPADTRNISSQHNSHKYKRSAQDYQRKVLGLSPIQVLGSACNRSNRSRQRRRRKRRRGRGWCSRLTKGEQDELNQVLDLDESSDNLLEDSYVRVSYSRVSQQRDGAYNISDILLPVSLFKVEKLQYNNIQTPSWRVVSPRCLTEADKEENKETEELGDHVFAQRHLPLEQKEKLRWSFWKRRKCFRSPTRSDSRQSGSGGGICTSGEESSVEWSSAQLDSDEQPWEERLPRASWELRVFPLDEAEEAALLSDEDGVSFGLV